MINYYKYKTRYGVLEVQTYDTGIKGKTLFVTAAIHGDEKCGTRALENLSKNLEEKLVQLQSGRLVFVKICNPLGYDQDRRFSIDGENLNRVFKRHTFASTPEREFANQLIDIVEIHACSDSDVYWLDLHSYYDIGGKPFIIVEYPTDKNLGFAKNLGIQNIFLGWNDLYTEVLDESGQIKEPCTIDFAHSIGLSGLTVECGGHKDTDSIQVAYDTILHAMRYLGLSLIETEHKFKTRFIKMEEIVRKPSDDWTLSQHWRNLDAVPKGTTLAIHKMGPDSGLITADNDSLILLPSINAKTGTEWFYLGKSMDK
jgi:predicted deacylase